MKVGNLQNVYKFKGNTKGENKEMTRALQAENNVSYCMSTIVVISGVHESREAIYEQKRPAMKVL